MLTANSYQFVPGQHSHNIARWRRETQERPRSSLIRILRLWLLILGVSAVGYYLYSLADQYVYQSYENWRFDQAIAGRPPTNSPDQPPTGTVLGRIEVARLHLSAIVRQGVDAKTLSLAVGHVASTALPGGTGNVAIAAHRDTLFRALKDIHTGDLVSFQSENAIYTYRVLATKIVKPSDVSVLQANGGGIIPGASRNDKLLTMITCYPFYYVGAAPERFIVQGKLVSKD